MTTERLAMTDTPAETDSIWETMRTARAIRRFRDEPVPDDVLLRCLEAATWAPSGGNSQQWRFIVLQSAETRAAMADAALATLKLIQVEYGVDAAADADDSARARLARAVHELHENAAEVPVAVLFALRPHPGYPKFPQGASIYPAVQNFLLAARAQGLGALLTMWHDNDGGRLRELIDVPDDWLLAGLVVAGWPRGSHGPVRRRPPTEVTVVDHWDRPLDLA